MKIGQMVESKYLRQEDIDEPTIVTVAQGGVKKVNVARDDEEPEYRWTVRFEELSKPMVCNVTNLKRMGKYAADDSDDWPGKKVVLYVDHDIEYGGKIVGGLRIRGLPSASTKKQFTARDVNAEFDQAARKPDDDFSDDPLPF